MELHALQTVSIALGLGAGLYALARWLRMPAILFYLLAGLAAGPLGLGWVDVSSLGGGLIVLVEFAMAIILFEGGLSLSQQGFLAAPNAIRRLLSVTTLLNLAGAALLSWWLLGLSWEVATLFGAITVVTGPTVIGPLLKSVHLTHRLEALLHWESIWGDVLGVLLAATALELIHLSSLTEVGGMALPMAFALSIAVGLGVGGAGGLLLDRVILPWADRLGDSALPGVIAFAAAPGLFVLANAFSESSGPLAAAVAGYLLSRQRGETLHSLRHFKDQLAVIFISALFVLLSASIDPRPYLSLWPQMLALTAIMALVLRPLAVQAALWGTCASMSERLYAGLIGPRGVIALATAAYAALTIAGHEGEMQLLLTAIFALVFLTGALTTLLGQPLARWLKVTVPETACGVIIVGANQLSLALAEFIEEFVPVVFLDTRPGACQNIQTKGHRALCTKVLDDELYETAGNEGFCRLIAMTANDALNELTAQHAARRMGERQVFRVQALPPERQVQAGVSSGQLAFCDRFYLSEALEHLQNGTASLQMFSDLDPERQPEGVFPMLQILPHGSGVQLLTPGQPARGNVLALVYQKK